MLPSVKRCVPMNNEPYFLMGKYKAPIPSRFLYNQGHLWIAKGKPSTVGLTSYRQRFFLDIEQISFNVKKGDVLKPKTQIAKIEGVKAVSEVISGFSGMVVEINEELNTDPTLINSSNYEQGWLVKVDGVRGDFLEAQEYIEFIQREWEDTVENILEKEKEHKKKSGRRKHAH
jgi:glycine cleavage system H protein